MTGTGAGTGAGVTGSGGHGVHGISGTASGAGCGSRTPAAAPRWPSPASRFFSRSGLLTVTAGKSPVTQTGVGLTPASLVLAMVQQNLSGVYVRAAVPNIAGSSFTVYLSKAPTASAKVAWFVVN